jgi:hypothetical protein
MSAYLNDVFLPVRCMPTCMMCSTVWWLFNCMISSYLYDIWLTVRCLPSCISSAQQYDVCLSVWSLPTRIMYALLYDVFISVCRLPTLWRLLNCVISAQMNFCLPVWCLLYCMMSAVLYFVLFCEILSLWKMETFSPCPLPVFCKLYLKKFHVLSASRNLQNDITIRNKTLQFSVSRNLQNFEIPPIFAPFVISRNKVLCEKWKS